MAVLPPGGGYRTSGREFLFSGVIFVFWGNFRFLG